MVQFGSQSRSQSEFLLGRLSVAKMDVDSKKIHIRSNSSDILIKRKDPSAEKRSLEESDQKKTLPSAAPGDLRAAVPPRVFGKVVISLENSILPKDRLASTPSEKDGLDPRSEWFLRRIGCDFIQHAGIILKLPQTAMATAQVLYHRFYYARSFVRNDYLTMGMACVYLSSKVEECPKRLRDIISVFTHVRQVLASLPIKPVIVDLGYVERKNQVIKCERRLLKELGFCVHIKHPHKIMFMYMKQLGLLKTEAEMEREFEDLVDHQNLSNEELGRVRQELEKDKLKRQDLLQRSWNYMNDSLRTDLFVRFSPEAIACGCIFLAARELKFPLPTNPAWYMSLLKVSHEDITDIASNISLLYSIKVPAITEVEQTLESIRESKGQAKVDLLSAIKGVDDVRTPESSQPSPDIVVAERKESRANGDNSRKHSRSIDRNRGRRRQSGSRRSRSRHRSGSRGHRDRARETSKGRQSPNRRRSIDRHGSYKSDREYGKDDEVRYRSRDRSGRHDRETHRSRDYSREKRY